MGRLPVSGLLLAGMLLVAPPVFATETDGGACCYCSETGDTGQVHFCAEAGTQMKESELESRCTELGGALSCLVHLGFNNFNNSLATCGAQLQEVGVSCPIRNGAPTASATSLSILVVVFAAVGLFNVRRRARVGAD